MVTLMAWESSFLPSLPMLTDTMKSCSPTLCLTTRQGPSLALSRM
jgi:hypothetical protein